MEIDNFHLKILTPEKTCFDDKCISLKIQTDDGQIEVLPKHTSLVSSITNSLSTVKLMDGAEKVFSMRLGLLFVNNANDEVLVNVFDCDFVENIQHENLLEYHSKILEDLKKGDLSPLQIRFLENQSESVKQMVEIHKNIEK